LPSKCQESDPKSGFFRDLLEISNLTPAQRITLGRIHALRFGNCRANLRANLNKGAQVAGSFTTMGASPEFSDLSVAEYLAVARRYFAALSPGTGWFTPFDIKAMLPKEMLERGRGAHR
jgi:hypothetical protein